MKKSFFFYNWFFAIHSTIRVIVYVACWAMVFGVLAFMATKSPYMVQAVITAFNPITSALSDLLWSLTPVPQEILNPLRETLGWLGSKTRKAAAWVGPTAELTVNVAFSGFIAVSIIAWFVHVLPMSIVSTMMKQRLVKFIKEG